MERVAEPLICVDLAVGVELDLCMADAFARAAVPANRRDGMVVCTAALVSGRMCVMRYGTETRLSPEKVIERARAAFGEESGLGLPESAAGPGSVVFATKAGGVEVTAVARAGKTEVTVLSREYDFQAERFIRDLG
jgi:hypothetical protein